MCKIFNKKFNTENLKVTKTGCVMQYILPLVQMKQMKQARQLRNNAEQVRSTHRMLSRRRVSRR